MCCNHGDFRLCINLNTELVHGDTGRMSMRRSSGFGEGVCHLVALTVSLFFSYPLSNSAPLLTWGLREGAQRNLSRKCSVNVTAAHMGQQPEQHFHLLLRSSLCPITQVTIMPGDHSFPHCWHEKTPTFNGFSIHLVTTASLTFALCRKSNNGCLRHPSLQAGLYRQLSVHTAHFLPQSLLDVLPTWTWWCSTTVGRIGTPALLVSMKVTVCSLSLQR